MSKTKILHFLIFFTGCPAVIVCGILLLKTWPDPAVSSPALLGQTSLPETGLVLSAASPPSSLSASVISGDARPAILRAYLDRYGSELSPYSEYLVAISDKYQLDFRLLVAIAQQESNLCKKIPPNSFNCWGFGIYGDKITRFDNYYQAIEIVARTLKREYLDKGLKTPEQIMTKYTPPSVALGGPWAKAVNQFLKQME